MPRQTASNHCDFSRPVGRHGRLSGLFCAALALCLGLSGCTARPMATSIPMAPQPVLQSAGQWQVVAEDVASAISAHLEFQMGRKVPVQLYMMRRDDTLFADAFLNAVTTRLVQKGHLVAVDARPDVTSIGIDVLTVKSNAPRLDSSLTPGPLTILAAGVGVASALSGGALPKFPWGITASALALGSDMWNNRPPETDTELILTVSIAREGFYTFRTSAVYYVNEADIWQYIGGGQVPVGGGSVNLNKVPQGVVRYDLAGKPYIMKN